MEAKSGATPIEMAAFADLHGALPPAANCDILVLAGDVCPNASAEAQRFWLERTLRPWLERQPAKVVIGIAGNCDLIAAKDPELMRSLPWRYLENEATEVEGLIVYGSPLALPFGAWPFMAPEHQLAQVFTDIPTETDLLVVHGPPWGIGDRTIYGTNAAYLQPPGSREGLKLVGRWPCHAS